MDIVTSITRVLAIGLLFGAGLPALFAVGMRLEAIGHGDTGKEPNAVPRVLGYVLFAIAGLVIAIAILWITRQTLYYYFDLKIFPDFAYKK
ncbi:hypothetical protein [Gordonia sp. (in: high G+C Gram-positive bacteria)]|uniref:hypothetical protein n=1 Tax=Gordonia sp. (in: high G+C Gram-positive bacteria) TaxID=84139 RepID=UPI003C7113DC